MRRGRHPNLRGQRLIAGMLVVRPCRRGVLRPGETPLTRGLAAVQQEYWIKAGSVALPAILQYRFEHVGGCAILASAHALFCSMRFVACFTDITKTTGIRVSPVNVLKFKA